MISWLGLKLFLIESSCFPQPPALSARFLYPLHVTRGSRLVLLDAMDISVSRMEETGKNKGVGQNRHTVV